MLPTTTKEEPWRKVIVVRPGCEDEIKKAGIEANKLAQNESSKETAVVPPLTNCHEYPQTTPRRESEH